MNKVNKLRKAINLRNTYTVPAGKEVVVQTPQGEHKYTGGQFVPPSQVGNMQERPASGGKGQSGGKNGEADPNAPLQEAFNNIKHVNINKIQDVNQALYQLAQISPLDINVSSNRVHPLARLGAELALVHLSTFFPGIKQLLTQLSIKIQLNHPQDVRPVVSEVFGRKFIKIGEASFKDNSITYWPIGLRPLKLLKDSTEFVSKKLGLIVINYLQNKLKTVDKDTETLQKQIGTTESELNKVVQTYLLEHKNRPPKAGANDTIDKLNQQLQELQKQFEQTISARDCRRT